MAISINGIVGSPCSHPNPYGGFLQWGYPKTMDFNMIYQNSLSLDTPIFGNPHISNAMLRIFAAKSPSCAPSGRSVQAVPQASLTFPSGQVGPKMKYVMCIVYYITLYYIILYYVILCYIILYYVILYYVILYYIILYIYVILYIILYIYIIYYILYTIYYILYIIYYILYVIYYTIILYIFILYII